MEIFVRHLKHFFLFVISLPFFSRLWGKITKIQFPSSLVRQAIRRYAEHYKIDMNEFEGDLETYDSLAEFFTRKIDPAIRPLKDDKNAFLSPCDGKITVFEEANADIATQVKGKTYLLSELIRKEINFADGCYLVTIYLSPRDYHRFHVPVDSTAAACIHTGWRLYPVNSFGLSHIDELFIKNERVSVKFKTDSFEYFYTAVGATFVGSIRMDFTDEFSDEWTAVGRKYRQNQELGRFEMGSTIVLLLPRKAVEKVHVSAGCQVRAGEPLFTLKNSSEK